MDTNNSGNQNQNPIAGALTYPTSTAGDAQRVPVQPRQPSNLQGLLRFAMEATKAEDAPGFSHLGPMDEERRKFLEEALKSLTVDIVAVLQDSIKVLSDAEKVQAAAVGADLSDELRVAFDNLMQYIDDVDVANDFYKLGGFSIFPVCYGAESENVRAMASGVLAELTQNNPFCQARALESGLLNVLLNLVQTEKGTALAKCLYALSCASREFEPACKELIAQGGCGTLAELLRNPDLAARTKAAFFISYLCQNFPEAKAQFISRNIIKIIAEQIQNGRDSTTEHLLSILLTLIEGLDPTALQQCKDPSLGLKKTLEDHLKHPDLVGDSFLEEKEYAQELIRQLFSDGKAVASSKDEEVDR